ncbi:hypothetical protein SDC9_175530 [bioreactor metagenome]|uniref:Uncharacterized protein n=1 Tax=bioreactor metagenome TaxID=1076179 RepID=A0A645GMC8_9ZZZZ
MVNGRLATEQSIVVIGDFEQAETLCTFVTTSANTNIGCIIVIGISTVVFINRHIALNGNRRLVVDGSGCNGEGLRGGCIDSSVGCSSVIG